MASRNFGCFVEPSFNCNRKIPSCLVTLLTLKISTRVIVQCVVYFSHLKKTVINLFSANFRDFCKVIPFSLPQTFKGVFVSGESDE